jgi:hypothetical protein
LRQIIILGGLRFRGNRVRIGILGQIGLDASVWNAARPGGLGSFGFFRFWVLRRAIRLTRLRFGGFSIFSALIMGRGGSFGIGLCFRFGFGEAGASVSL